MPGGVMRLGAVASSQRPDISFQSSEMRCITEGRGESGKAGV